MGERHSVYTLGANDGWKMGIYLSAMYLLQSAGLGHPLMLFVGNLLLLGIPFFAYFLLRRGYVASHGVNTFSAVWLHGIIFFLCGSLIMALVAYVYMRFVKPNFIVEQIQLAADTYRSFGTAQGEQFAHQLERIVTEHMVPSAIQMALTLMWLCSFVGSILSLLLTLIVRAIKVRERIQ